MKRLEFAKQIAAFCGQTAPDVASCRYDELSEVLGITLEPDEEPLPERLIGYISDNYTFIGDYGGYQIIIKSDTHNFSRRLLKALVDAYNNNRVVWHEYPAVSPTTTDDYLVTLKGGQIKIYFWYEGSSSIGWSGVTHWMSIPEPNLNETPPNPPHLSSRS